MEDRGGKGTFDPRLARWTGWLLVAMILMAACRPTGLRLPESPLLRNLERKSGRIAYLGPDGNIYVIDQGGGQQTAITADARNAGETQRLYRSPTWALDGRQLAYIGVEQDAQGNAQSFVYTSDGEGDEAVEIFRSEEHVPIYLYWTPDSQQVTFISAAPTVEGLSLHLVPASGGDGQVLARGSPFYWNFSPDGRNLITHTGGSFITNPAASLSLLALGGEAQATRLNLHPAFFQAPAWSPRGDELLLAAMDTEGKLSLIITDLAGEIKRDLLQVQNRIAFGWSPDGLRLAYIQSEDNDGQILLGKLNVLHPGVDETPITSEENLVIGFFWSPDSQKVAFFELGLMMATPEPGQETAPEPDIGISLHIMSVESGETIRVATFRPSDGLVEMLPFFDQYQHSATIWSPDNRNLVISALDTDNEPGIFVVPADGNLQPRYIAPGDLAFWSWK